MEKIPEIRQIINDAIEKTRIAESSLAGARNNAQDALSKAETANELAKNASKNAESISQEAVQLNQNATKVKNEAELMADRVKNTAIEFNNLLRETENNASLINEAKDKVQNKFYRFLTYFFYIEYYLLCTFRLVEQEKTLKK